MKLIIFIGHFKTGSSSIQSFLSSNYLALLRAGILYPSVESQGLSRNLAVMRDRRDRPTAGKSLNIIEPHNALALRLKNEDDGHGIPPYYPAPPSGFQMLQTLQNQINELEPSSVILCSEVFALLGMTATGSGVERLARRFSHHEVMLYCNLRRPDEYLSSWHRQRLKFGAKIQPLSGGGLDEYLDSAHFQQVAMIEGWRRHFPNARLVVRNFDQVRHDGGSIVDFMRHSTLSFPTGLQIPKDQNPSVPSAFFEVGRRAIHELPQDKAIEIVRWLTGMRRRIPHPADGEVEMFGVANRTRIADSFAPIAQALDRITGGGPFYPHLSDIREVRATDYVTAARTVLPLLIANARSQSLSEPAFKWLSSLDLHAR